MTIKPHSAAPLSCLLPVFEHPPNRRTQDGAYFGALKCKKDYIGEILPTLITNEKESHQTFRQHALKAFGSRVPYAQSAIDNATDTFYKNLWKNGERLPR